MSLRLILFSIGFFLACIGGLFNPIISMFGYMVEYSIGPGSKWWAIDLRRAGLRFSLTLAAFTAVGIVLNLNRLRWGKKFTLTQEKLMIAFVLLMWVLVFFTGGFSDRYLRHDPPAVKMVKVLIFIFIMTHLVTSMKYLRGMIWVLVTCAFILGWQAYTTPYGHWVSGRLETVGGPDFRESNIFAAFISAMVPLIGIQFLLARKYWQKGLCMVAGVFAVNAMILCRSRGAMVGMALGGVVAGLLLPKGYRGKIILGRVVASIGAYNLMDDIFVRRSQRIVVEEDERGRSANKRIEVWKASVEMLEDKPLGVGPGKFEENIGRYDINVSGTDAHNVFVTCYGELGIPGIILFLSIIGTNMWMLLRIRKTARNLPPPYRHEVIYISYGMILSMVTFLGCGLTVTLLYIEGFWWVLMMPVCLRRAVDNLQVQLASEEEDRTDTPPQPQQVVALPRRERA